MTFEWNLKKASANIQKHRVSFSEAATVFDDAYAAIFDDIDHSITERRELIIGTSELARILIVSFTQRGESTRIISARPANRRERGQHMKSTRKPTTRRRKNDDMRANYEFDYDKAKPNRFAQLKKEQTVVLLDKDLSKVFKTQEEVNHALRSLVKAMPKRRTV